MARVLGGLATLSWVAGIVLLVVGIVNLTPDIHVGYSSSPGDPAATGIFVYSPSTPIYEVIAGTAFVGVAGLLTAGLVLADRRGLAGSRP